MKLRTTIPLGGALLIALGSSLSALVTPNGIFGDHMVLQRNIPIPVWGHADPGERITISLDQEKATTLAGLDGSWRVTLPAQYASSIPISMSITGNMTPAAITLGDILIGDVWLCSGQSNMTLYLKYLTNFPGVTDDMTKADLPLIRQGTVARQPSIDPVESRSVAWTSCATESVGMYSAAGFYFARQLQKQTEVPVGIILSSFGSTSLEEWVSREVLAGDPASKKRVDHQRERYNLALTEKQGSQTWHGAIKAKIRSWIFSKSSLDSAKILNKTATAHYNGMIRPLAPFPIKGVIWYQGEEEALEKVALNYRRQLPLFIANWRTL